MSHDNELQRFVRKSQGLSFNGLSKGREDGELVLFLHGFPQFADMWLDIMGAVAKAGFQAVAVDQRGYSPCARPSEVADYAIELLIADTAAFADGLGRKRFHIVGRDWGAMVAWEFAATHPAQLLSLSALSTPDPDALFDAIANDEDQKLRSSTLRFSECPAMRPKLHCKQTIISAFVRHTKARFLRPPSGKMSVADQNRVIEFGAELVLGLGLRTANWKNSGADSLHLGLGGSGARRDRRPWYRGTCDGTVSFQETRRQITLARRGGS